MRESNELKTGLSHVLWIGGGTDAGKTSVAEAIVKRYNFATYNFDRHERSHIERMEAVGYYQGRKNPYEKTADELWVDPEPEEMAADIIRGWAKRAEYAIEDLLDLPRDTAIIAEGPGFFPEVIAPLLSSPHQAIWFVPEPGFKRKIAVQRGKPGVRLQTRDPARATENIIGRDLLVAQHVKQEATALGLRWLEIDGKLPIEQLVGIVERHFAPYLLRQQSDGLDASAESEG